MKADAAPPLPPLPLPPLPLPPRRRVGYLFCPELVQAANLLQSNPGRSSYVHSLVHAYGLDRALHILPAIPASDAQLRQFHRDDYVAFVTTAEYREGADAERLDGARGGGGGGRSGGSAARPGATAGAGSYTADATKEPVPPHVDAAADAADAGSDAEAGDAATPPPADADADADADANGAADADGTTDAETQYRRDVERFNLSNDCPVFAGMEAYVRWVAGSTILAARHLLYSDFDVVINWDGGRHHSKAAEASGFCYVNDIVLGINELLTHHDRVLYVDLDIHHGDGVEAAYRQSDRVMTVSFHRYDGQFFPKTGHTAEHGVGRGAGFALNVPLRSGLRGEALVPFYTTVMDEVLAAFRPGAIVIQCGADGMAGDPLGGKWNLDMISYTKCVMHLVNQNRPALVLGGGGYSRTICARTWTFLTAAILDVAHALSPEIPQHALSEEYRPDANRLWVEVGTTPRDHNDAASLAHVAACCIATLETTRRRVDAAIVRLSAARAAAAQAAHAPVPAPPSAHARGSPAPERPMPREASAPEDAGRALLGPPSAQGVGTPDDPMIILDDEEDEIDDTDGR